MLYITTHLKQKPVSGALIRYQTSNVIETAAFKKYVISTNMLFLRFQSAIFVGLGIYWWKLNLLGICIFNWVFVKFILGNTIISLFFLYNINYFNWVSINYYAFCYILFKTTIGYSRKKLGKYPKKQLICFSDNFYVVPYTVNTTIRYICKRIEPS